MVQDTTLSSMHGPTSVVSVNIFFLLCKNTIIGNSYIRAYDGIIVDTLYAFFRDRQGMVYSRSYSKILLDQIKKLIF